MEEGKEERSGEEEGVTFNLVFVPLKREREIEIAGVCFVQYIA